MQCGIQDQILDQKKNMGGKISEIKIKSEASLKVLYQWQFPSLNHYIIFRQDVNNRGSWVKSQWELFVLFVNFYVSLKLFQNKM